MGFNHGSCRSGDGQNVDQTQHKNTRKGWGEGRGMGGAEGDLVPFSRSDRVSSHEERGLFPQNPFYFQQKKPQNKTL